MSSSKSVFQNLKQFISQMFEIRRLLKESKKMKAELGDIEYTDDQRRRLLEKAKKLSPECSLRGQAR